MSKSSYETHVEPFLNSITEWARSGLTVRQIASNLGINPSTLYRYLKDNSELETALYLGKNVADAEVENSLFKSAVGFQYQTQELTKDGRTMEIEKYQIPNTTAQIFWLKNRRPEAWRDKQEVSHGPTEDLAKLIEEAFASVSGETQDTKTLPLIEMHETESDVGNVTGD